MINNIEVLINSLLRDLLVQGPNAEVRIRKNTMVAHPESRQGRHNLNMYSNNLCITDDAFAMESIVYGHLRKRQRLAMLIFVLSEIHELLVSRNCCTYRELYYKCVYMDCSQRQIIKSVQDASQLLGQTSWNLGIFSSGKGMVTGSYVIVICFRKFISVTPSFSKICSFPVRNCFILEMGWKRFTKTGSHISPTPLVYYEYDIDYF